MDHKQQQSLNEAIIQQVFGSPSSSSPSSSIDESKMAELHSLIQDGKTAEQISKIMNITLSTIKMLMKDFKEEALSSSIDEADNTAAVAKQVKKAVKEYTTGKLVVRSKGGKTRFIMVAAGHIDNELRKMILDIVAPNANVRDKDDISYGNVSDRIISAGVDVWIEALGLKEEEAAVSSSSSSLDEKSFRDFDVPASPEMKKHIESGKAKILYSGVSDLGPTTRFVVIVNPKFRNAKVSGQDKVLMFTISDPKRGRIKMFAFHGSHISLAKAMQFAKNNKLVVKESVLDDELLGEGGSKIPSRPTRIAVSKEFDKVTRSGKMDTMAAKDHLENKFGITDVRIEKDKNGKPHVTYFQESVEHLDEALTLSSDDLNAVKKTAEKLARQSPDLTYYVVKHKDRHFNGKEIPYYAVYASEDWHIARSQGAKKVAGYGANVKESVDEELDESNHDQSAADKALWNAMKVVGPRAGWKMVKTDPSRFGDDVEITSQKMSKYGDWTLMTWSDGKLMHVWYEHPNGEGSVPEKEFKRVAKDMMKESVLDEVRSIAPSVESRKKVTKVLKKKGIGFHTSKGVIMVNPMNIIAAKSALNKEFAGDFETNSGMKLKATKKVGISDEVELDEEANFKEIQSKGKKLGDWVGKTYYLYEGNLWVLGGYGGDVVNRGPIDEAKKDLNKILLKNLKF